MRAHTSRLYSALRSPLPLITHPNRPGVLKFELIAATQHIIAIGCIGQPYLLSILRAHISRFFRAPTLTDTGTSDDQSHGGAMLVQLCKIHDHITSKSVICTQMASSVQQRWSEPCMMHSCDNERLKSSIQDAAPDEDAVMNAQGAEGTDKEHFRLVRTRAFGPALVSAHLKRCTTSFGQTIDLAADAMSASARFCWTTCKVSSNLLVTAVSCHHSLLFLQQSTLLTGVAPSVDISSSQGMGKFDESAVAPPAKTKDSSPTVSKTGDTKIADAKKRSSNPTVPGLAKASPRSGPSPVSSRLAAPATAKTSARGKSSSPVGAALGSARSKKPAGNPLGSTVAPSARKPETAPVHLERPGTSPAPPAGSGTARNVVAQPPPSRPPSAPQMPVRKASPRGGRKDKEEPIMENPCLVTAPVPPLPPNIKKPLIPTLSPAGARPRGRQDGAPSRHDLAPGLGVSLLFNCFKAKFEIISGDVAGISDHDPFDLKGPRSQVSQFVATGYTGCVSLVGTPLRFAFL